MITYAFTASQLSIINVKLHNFALCVEFIIYYIKKNYKQNKAVF